MVTNTIVKEAKKEETKEYALTTIDNPYNPFTQFDEWLSFDTQRGYNTCGYLARIAKTSHDLSEEDQALAILIAIDEIVKENVYGVHVKVTNESFRDRIKLRKVNL